MIILRYKQFSKHKDIELKSWKPNLKHPDIKLKKDELEETSNKYPEDEFEPQEEDEWIDEEVNEYPDDDDNYE